MHLEVCNNFGIVRRSKEWAIMYLLYFLNLAATLELFVFNTVSFEVFRTRIKKRSEARALQMFALLGMVDFLIAFNLTARDCIYVWGESYSMGIRLLRIKREQRFIDGALLTWRNFITLLIVAYYLVVYLSPYQSERIAHKINSITLAFGFFSFSLCSIDLYTAKVYECRKLLSFFLLNANQYFDLFECIFWIDVHSTLVKATS